MDDTQIQELVVLLESAIPDNFDSISTADPKMIKMLETSFIKIENLARETIEHLQHGDLNDKQRNQALWHNLKGLTNPLLFAARNTHYDAPPLKAALNLVDKLEECRPSEL